MGKIFLRLPQVLERIPVSRSTWWNGVRTGIFPAPIKLTTRTTAWTEESIDALAERLIVNPLENHRTNPTPNQTSHNHHGCHDHSIEAFNERLETQVNYIKGRE